MKVLWLALESSEDHLKEFTKRLGELCDLQVFWLSPKQAKNIARTVGGDEIKAYDRVLVYLPISTLIKQSAYIRCIPNLVLLQRDLPIALTRKSSDLEKYGKMLSLMPWVRVLVSVGTATTFMKKRKIDYRIVPIGFESERFHDMQRERSLHAAIVGDVENPPVKNRKHLLFDIKTHNKLQIYDTPVGDDLVTQLNQIKVVVCSDEGCAGYRALNFQAMACGALLMTWDRGEEENNALGFIDMKNVILFKDDKSANAKLNFLKRHDEELNAIKEQGKQLAQQLHSNKVLAETTYQYLEEPLKKFSGDDINKALKFRFFR